MTPDPKPSSEPWLDHPLMAEEMRTLRTRLSKMTHAELMKFYDTALEMCRFNQNVPPRAAFIQQLVASWKEMQRRRTAGVRAS
jgi:hypothetical protein